MTGQKQSFLVLTLLETIFTRLTNQSFMLLEGCTSSRALCKEQFTAEHKPSEGRSFSG